MDGRCSVISRARSFGLDTFLVTYLWHCTIIESCVDRQCVRSADTGLVGMQVAHGVQHSGFIK